MEYSQTTHKRPLMNFAKPFIDCLWKFSNLAAQDNSDNFKTYLYIRLEMVTFHKVVA